MAEPAGEEGAGVAAAVGEYFVAPCQCAVAGKLAQGTLNIKEATTGYLDPSTGQSVGSFVTYVIELQVRGVGVAALSVCVVGRNGAQTLF